MLRVWREGRELILCVSKSICLVFSTCPLLNYINVFSYVILLPLSPLSLDIFPFSSIKPNRQPHCNSSPQCERWCWARGAREREANTLKTLMRVKKNRREYVLWHITSHLLQKHSLFSPSVSRNIPLWETYALLRSITFQSFILSYFLFFLCLIIMILEISSCFSLSVSCDPSWCEKSDLEAHNFKSIRANQESI